eukprot:scaffold8.g1531.t1
MAIAARVVARRILPAFRRTPSSPPGGVAAARHACSVTATEAGTEQQQVAIVAFGGNALLKRGEKLGVEVQRKNAAAAAASVAALVQEGLTVAVTHGNGPQVGLLAIQDPDSSLDVLDAESEGQIGYLLQEALENAMPDREVVTLLTEVVVSPDDPAFSRPTKHIGPVYSQEEAERLARDKGWSIAQDTKGWRRVVASPAPLDIVETRAIKLLMSANVITISCGGGGIPVALDQERRRRYGLECVIDKDKASALLASKLRADWLLMLTDEPAICDPNQFPDRKVPLPSPISVPQLAAYRFAEGSMKPKVDAAVRFVRETGGRAAVGSLDAAVQLVRGTAGTIITAG